MKKQISYKINEQEAELINNCLGYCFHRLYNHKKIIRTLNLKEINKLRNQFYGKITRKSKVL